MAIYVLIPFDSFDSRRRKRTEALTKAGNIFFNRAVPQPGTSSCRTREKQGFKSSMGHIITSKKIAVALPLGAQKSNEVRPA